MHPHLTTRPRGIHARGTHRATLLLAALMGSATLAGCGSSGSSGIVATPPAAATGGPTRSVGYSASANGTTNQFTIGTNDTTLNAGPTAATLTTSAGAERVVATLPFERQGPLAADPNNLSGKSFQTRFYTRRGTPTAPNSEEALSVIDGEYARLAAFSTVENGRLTSEGLIASPVGPSTPRTVPTNGTATYTGRAFGTFIERDRAIASLNGVVTLTADFGSGTVAGRIDDIGSPVDVVLEKGIIQGSDYSGDARLVSRGRNLVNTEAPGARGTFQGGFYGPAANETSGLVDIEGNQPSGTQGGLVGGYIATKQ